MVPVKKIFERFLPYMGMAAILVGRSPLCYIYQVVWKSAQKVPEKIFEGFYHIWAWRPSWSCDLDHLYKL